MTIPESPYQRLIDIIDTILSKNETTPHRGEISIHVLEIPSLPQNGFGIEAIGNLLKNLKQKGAISEFKYKGGPYVLPKLNPSEEKSLLLERKSLAERANVDARPTHAKVFLKDQKVIFNDEESTIAVGKYKCPLPPFKNEHYFCRAMFNHLPNEPVDWSLVYKEMTGGREDIPDPKNKRTVQDTMYAINNRFKEIINTDDTLFTWENRTIKRNF